MDKRLRALLIILIFGYHSYSQNVGIGTGKPDSSAALDITATNKGLLIPRMSLTSINAIPLPAKGLLAYDSLANQLMANIGTPARPNWQPVAGSTGGAWSLNGNLDTDPRTQFVGTTDNQPLLFRVNNLPAGRLDPVSGNVFWGLNAGRLDSGSFSNIAIGHGALLSNKNTPNLVAIGDSALAANTNGIENTALGSNTLQVNTSGSSNTAIGLQALRANTTGSSNTATGVRSLAANTSGSFNVANGQQALAANISGSSNVGVGFQALFSNTTATSNTAVGTNSMFSNSTGASNTATGSSSLFSNTTGNFNVADGISALFSNTTGIANTAVGFEALLFNGTGSENTAIGSSALTSNLSGNANIAIGQQALQSNSSGSDNIAIGNGALASNQLALANVAIGNQALALTNGTFSNNNTAVGANAGSQFALGENNTLIGADADAWGNGATNCVALGANSKCTQDNQVMLGNTSTLAISGFADFSKLSDGRFKKNIREDVQGLAFIMKLRPVTYQVNITALNAKIGVPTVKHGQSAKSIAEGEKVVHSGFIAQEVEQAAKDLGYDFSGVDKPQREGGLYALRYAEFVVPLVKAVQEQQQMIDGLKNRRADLASEVEALKKTSADEQNVFDNLQKRIEKLELSVHTKN